MRIIITEQQLKTIIQESYDINDEDDFYSLMNEKEYDVFSSIKNGEKITFNRINPIQYKNALFEFTKYGEFFRFPEKIVNTWKNICLRNTILLGVVTEICGHANSFPFDAFYDVFDEIPENKRNFDFTDAYEYLETQYNIDDYLPEFSNGQTLISDYGLDPLYELCSVLLKQNNPNDIIVTINKMLDISHQRSDLAELFIEGGSKSLNFITNN